MNVKRKKVQLKGSMREVKFGWISKKANILLNNGQTTVMHSVMPIDKNEAKL